MSVGIKSDLGATLQGITLSEVFFKVVHLDLQGRAVVVQALNYADAPFKGDRDEVIADAKTVFDAEFGATDPKDGPGEDRFLTQGSIWLSYGRNSKPKVHPSDVTKPTFAPKFLG